MTASERYAEAGRLLHAALASLAEAQVTLEGPDTSESRRVVMVAAARASEALVVVRGHARMQEESDAERVVEG